MEGKNSTIRSFIMYFYRTMFEDLFHTRDVVISENYDTIPVNEVFSQKNGISPNNIVLQRDFMNQHFFQH